MCRYGMSPYKSHYACFNCRKTFKRKFKADVNRGEDAQVAAKCPQCGELMANMGLDFESPKMNDLKSWAHIKSLYSVGITFHSCGCTGPGYIPNSKTQLIAYFEELKQGYFKEIEFWRHRKEPTDKRTIESDLSRNWDHIRQVGLRSSSKDKNVKNQDAINFWLSQIKNVEIKLSSIK